MEENNQTPPIQSLPAEQNVPTASPIQNEIPKSKFSIKKTVTIVFLFFVGIIILYIGFNLVYSALGLRGDNYIPQLKPLPTQTVSPTPVDLTANWETYSNSDLGVTFNYPKGYDIKTNKVEDPKDGSDVFYAGFLIPKDNASVVITRASPNFLREVPYSKTSISEEEFYNPANNFWLKGNIDNGAEGTMYEIPQIINAGENKFIVQARKPIRPYQGVKGNELYYNYYHWLSSSDVITIVLSTTSDNPKNDAANQTFQQILSTFKFTEQNQAGDTSTWKTFTNSYAHYSLKYPAKMKQSSNQRVDSFIAGYQTVRGLAGGPNMNITYWTIEQAASLALPITIPTPGPNRIKIDGDDTNISFSQLAGITIGPFKKGDFYYQIDYFDDGGFTSVPTELDQILPTFKFTN